MMILSSLTIAEGVLDTNTLLRWSIKTDPLHQVTSSAIQRLLGNGTVLSIAPQNVAEYWNVATRPVPSNGHGLTSLQVDQDVKDIESQFPVLEESRASYLEWRGLVASVGVSGIQVHDARLAALMRVHGIMTLITSNARDFVRYGITPVTPQSILDNI